MLFEKRDLLLQVFAALFRDAFAREDRLGFEVEVEGSVCPRQEALQDHDADPGDERAREEVEVDDRVVKGAVGEEIVIAFSCEFPAEEAEAEHVEEEEFLPEHDGEERGLGTSGIAPGNEFLLAAEEARQTIGEREFYGVEIRYLLAFGFQRGTQASDLRRLS